MKKFFFGLIAFFLVCAAICHLQIFGFFLKAAVKVKAHSVLVFERMRFEKGHLVLENAVLSNDSGYLLRSEKISVKVAWKKSAGWPFCFSAMLEKPRILIASEWLAGDPILSTPSFEWNVEMEEGILEWEDQKFSPSQFALKAASDESLEMTISWEKGALQLEKKGKECWIEFAELPFDFLSKLDLPGSDFKGTLNGHAAAIWESERLVPLALSLKGQELSFEWEKMRCRGNVSFDGEWSGGSIDRVRFSLDGGAIESSYAEVRDIQILTTYQSGLGIQCEGLAIAAREDLEIPLKWEGKGFFSVDKLDWASGEGQLGKGRGALLWKDPLWAFSWEGLGPAEAAVLQGFAALIAPKIIGLSWHSGTAKGDISFTNTFQEMRLEQLQIEDLRLKTKGIELQCRSLISKAGDWEIKEASVKGESPQLAFEGNAKWQSGLFTASGKWQEHLAELELDVYSMALKGKVGALSFSGNGEADSEGFLLSIPDFQGELPKGPWPSGTAASLEEGFKISGSWEEIKEWSIAAHVSNGAIVLDGCALSNLDFTLMADDTSADLLSAKGLLAFSIGENQFALPLFAPRIQWGDENGSFDIRIQNQVWDVLRLVGKKEKERIEIDPLHSHFFGAPLQVDNGLWDGKRGDFKTEIDGSLFQAFLNGLLPQSNLFGGGSLLKSLQFDLGQGFPLFEKLRFAGCIKGSSIGISLSKPPLKTKRSSEDSVPDWELVLEKSGSGWTQRFAMGSTLAACRLDFRDKAFRITEGKVSSPGISFAFEGKVTQQLEGDFILQQIWADLKRLPVECPLEGVLSGQGCVKFTKQEIESDLDLFVKEARFEELSFENAGPIHLYYSSLQGALFKGLDCRVQKNGLEAHAKIDLLQYDKKESRWAIWKAKTHFPSEFFQSFSFDAGSIDCLGDLYFSSDFSDWSCAVKEAFFPFHGLQRHLRDFQAFGRKESLMAEALFETEGNWAKVSFELLENSSGRLYLDEPEKDETPMAIDWSYKKESGIFIHSIEGAFAGIDASFHAFEPGRLIGSARLDFQRLSQWIPADVAEVFEELKMGKGYELKGNLQIEPKNLSQIYFQGIFSGKQIDLIGYQFRTLLARADLSPAFIRIFDLKISDSSGLLKIEDIRIRSEAEKPWTIEIPKLCIEDLRPSLFAKQGAAPGPISPLVVRQLKLTDFHGLLDDGKTWRAQGDLTFINSFKRENTVFDLPANVFGRIIGLDLELLIPVIGDLAFELKDGFFNLNELRGAYSEDRRSEFFLVHSDSTQPRMDLDGNLQILVKMKQFVLFSLTEAFMISIEGKLNDPSFRLQRKKRFL